MLRFIGFVCFVHFALCAKDKNNKPIAYGCRRGYLYTEILGLRQLVNQESLYRQELERQMREFRRQIKAIDARTCFPSGIKNYFLKSRLVNMSKIIDAKIESHIENMTSLAEKLDERMADIVIKNQRMTKNQDLIIEMVSNVSLDIQEVKSSSGKLVQHNNTIDKSECNDRLTSHTGKGFAIMIPSGKSNKKMPIHLIISSESNTKITMRSSYPGLNRMFNVKPPGTNITLPADFALKWSAGSKIQQRGIILESTNPVSVHVFHEDAHLALPAQYLGTYYKSLTTDNSKSFISIMPYGGSALVNLKSRSGVSTHSIKIPELSVYHLWSSSSFRNVILSSNQTIAVISGHHRSFSNKPQTIYDSVIPIKSWDTSYIIPYIKYTSTKYDFLYSTASQRLYTAVRNSQTSTQHIHQPYTYVSSAHYKSNFVQSVNGTMAVVLWFYRGNKLNSFGCVVPSFTHFSNNYHFWTPFHTSINFLAAIIKERDSDGLIMDDLLVKSPYMSNTVTTLNDGNYTVITIDVKQGWHSVTHKDTTVRFGLIMYGGNVDVAYGLPLGLKLD